jgi:hypothetical protein
MIKLLVEKAQKCYKKQVNSGEIQGETKSDVQSEIQGQTKNVVDCEKTSPCPKVSHKILRSIPHFGTSVQDTIEPL